MSILEKCLFYRGHEYYVTLKAPLMVLSVLLSKNWPKQVLEVHLNCLMDSTNHYNTGCTIPKTYGKL